jgi:acyl carrier protein
MTGQAVRSWVADQLAKRGSPGGDAIDSLAGVELILEAEEAFGIKVSQDSITSELCSSVDGVTSLLEGLVRAKELAGEK